MPAALSEPHPAAGVWGAHLAVRRSVLQSDDYLSCSAEATSNYVRRLGWQVHEQYREASDVWQHSFLDAELIIPRHNNFGDHAALMERIVSVVAEALDLGPVEVALGIAATVPVSTRMLAHALQSWFGPAYLFKPSDDNELGALTPYTTPHSDKPLVVRIYVPKDTVGVWGLSCSVDMPPPLRSKARNDVVQRGLGEQAWISHGILGTAVEDADNLAAKINKFVQQCLEVNAVAGTRTLLPAG